MSGQQLASHDESLHLVRALSDLGDRHAVQFRDVFRMIPPVTMMLECMPMESDVGMKWV